MRFNKVNIAIWISLVIFLISLTQYCMTYQYFGIVKYPSYSALLFGWMHFLGGGVLEGLIWLANPFYFIGLFLLYIKKKNAAVLSLFISCILALFLLTFESLTMTRSGRIAQIIELNSGYFLWIASILSLTFYSVLKIKINFKSINRDEL